MRVKGKQESIIGCSDGLSKEEAENKCCHHIMVELFKLKLVKAGPPKVILNILLSDVNLYYVMCMLNAEPCHHVQHFRCDFS